MADQDATLRTVEGTSVLELERRCPDPPERIWRVVSDPDEMTHWFPAVVEARPLVGAAMTFSFEGDDEVTTGEVREFDPPRVYEFRWVADVLRFEIAPDGDGSLLRFTQTLGGGATGRLTAARNAAGWDVCLDALVARLAGREFRQPAEWLPLLEHYVERFGLADGEVVAAADGYELRFARDLMWQPVEEVWSLLTDGVDVELGTAPPSPCTNAYVAAASVSAVAAPHVLEYEWIQDGAPAGRVRFELAEDPELGTRLELTQTVPARLAEVRATALAAWHTHLELLFATLLGGERAWPPGRTEELRETYARRLA